MRDEVARAAAIKALELARQAKVIAGQRGPKGDPGEKGEKGDSGQVIVKQMPVPTFGPVGPVGPEGPQGPRGFIGPQGIPGPVGPQGPEGPEGPQGPKGDAGPLGPQGPIGPVGVQGVIGPMPKHERKGLMFRFEKEPGQWGDWIVVPTGGGGGGRDDKLTDRQAELVSIAELIKQRGLNAGKVIGTDGTSLQWVTGGGGGVTSVTASAPLTSSGGATPDISLTGTVPISNGGTGQTTQGAAFDALAPTTSKGDLIVHNGTTDIRLPVGTNNHVLTADSTQASGVKWAAAAGGASPITISNKTGAYTVVAGDLGTIINCTSGTFTVSLTAAATLGSGFNCWVWNTGTGTITIDPNGSETIDSRTTLVLMRGEGTQVVCDGTNWQTGDKKTMRGYSDNITAGDTRPEASGTEAIALGNFSRATGANGVSIGRATLASGDSSVAIGRGPTASASYSTAIGINSSIQGSQAVTGSGAMALGGSYASGSNSFAAAMANNTSTYGATGSNSIAIGYQAKATTTGSCAIGYLVEATGTGAMSFGYQVQSTGSISTARGYRSLSSIYGKDAYASGYFASNGDAQLGKFVLRCATTNATATVLTSDNNASGTTNQVILPNNSAYAFTGTVVARQQASGGTASAAWKVEGLIRREATAGTTTLVASTVTAIDNTPGWTLALSADTTNGGLAVTATGAAATNIRWVATIQTSEVTYA